MASTIITKYGSGAPTASDLVQGELAVDLTNKRIYTEDGSTNILELGTNPTSLTIGGTALTATAAELNTLDGITATTAELNTLDGITATVTELNYTDGVTSNIQTQLNTKAPIASPTFTGTVTAPAVNVNGTVTADGLTVDGNARIEETDAAARLVIARTDATNSAESASLDLMENNLANLSFGDVASFGYRLEVNGSTNKFNIISGNQTTTRPRFSIDRDTGDISFYEDTGTTAKFFWDASAEQLVLSGSTPPKYDNGSVDLVLGKSGGAFAGYASNTISLLFNTYSVPLGIGTNAAQPLILATGNTERLRIDSSGRVGIGTTNPFGNLDINGGGYATTGGTLIVRQRGDTNADGIALTSSNATSHRIWKDASGSLNIGSSSAPSAFVQDTSGTLYISKGTGDTFKTNNTAPSGFSATRLYNDTDNGITILNYGSTYSAGTVLNIGASGTSLKFSHDAGINVATGKTLRFGVGGSERARIDSSGNLLVGQTANSITTVGAVIRAAGQVGGCADSNWAGAFTRKTSDGNVVLFLKDTSIVGSISVTGSATAYNTSSDYRLKENVVSMDNASDRVLALNPVRFNFITEPEKTVDGFLAHEAQTVVPEAVHGVKDEVDDEGNPVYQGIDQSKLVPLLTKALQEALTEIADLKARVSALETN